MGEANSVSSCPHALQCDPGHKYSTIWRVVGMGILDSCAFITCKNTDAESSLKGSFLKS